MKKLKRVFVITLFMLLLIINGVYAETGKVNTNTVRVRENASTSSEIITNVYKNDEVEIIEKEGDWYKVKVEGKTGYVKSDFLDITNSSSGGSSTSSKEGSQESSGFTTNKQTKVRVLPSVISLSVGSIEAGKEVTKLDEINNWYKVTDGKITGWILSNRIGGEISIPEQDETESDEETNTVENTVTNSVTNTVTNETSSKEENTVSNETTTSTSSVNKVGIINVKTARIRSKASTSGEIIDLLDYNDEVTILEKEGTWYKITYGNNKEGYIDSSLVTMKDSQGVSSRSLGEERQTEKKEETVEDTPVETAPPASSASGQAVVDFAKQYLGYPYVSAGKRPETGFDCSGFTGYVFSNFGTTLGGSAASQVSAGREVDRGSLVAGDLLLFYDDGKTKIGHAGIYIGGGDFIHAANPKRGVVIDNINTSSYYNERYVTARRIVE